MRIPIALLILLFSCNAFAERIACTTRLINTKTDKTPKVKICGAVSLDRILDNGIKYRRIPRFCKKFVIEFFSVRRGDKSQFVSYCKKIHSQTCYVIKIRDNASREGMGQLSSHMVFSSVKTMPEIFSLNAGGVGHKTGVMPGPGRMVRMNLSCRVTK